MQFVFSTSQTKRYKFPTHINDLVIDRSDAHTSEVFVVVLELGQATPTHKHDDTEQIFYMLEGEGTLAIAKEGENYPVKAGDVVRIPPSTLHTIKADGGNRLKYLTIDCFTASRFHEERTWDDHVRVLCREQGWDYDSVIR